VDRRFATTDLAVIAVIFSDEDRKAVERLSREVGLDIPEVISRDGKVRKAYQANLVPTVVLINREGQMVKRLVGFKNFTVLEAEIAALF